MRNSGSRLLEEPNGYSRFFETEPFLPKKYRGSLFGVNRIVSHAVFVEIFSN